MKRTELTNIYSFNEDNISLSEPKTFEMPVKHQRLAVNIKYPSGQTGPLIFQTEQAFTFGVSENTSPGSSKITGYSVPICLYSMDGKTDYETQFVSVINRTTDKIKKLLLTDEMRLALNKPELDESDLKKLNPIWYKREGLKIIENKATLYAKLICNKDLHIYTSFTDIYGNQINPSTLIGQKFTGYFAIKIESVFVGTKISLQVKAVDVVVLEESKPNRLLIARKPMEYQEEFYSSQNGSPAKQEDIPVLVKEEQKSNDIEESGDEEEEELLVIERPKPTTVRGRGRGRGRA